MKKTKNFDEYLKESANLTPLTDDEIVIAEEEENTDLVSDDEENDDEENDDTKDFEVQDVETDELDDLDAEEKDETDDRLEDSDEEDTEGSDEFQDDEQSDEMGMLPDTVESEGSKVVYLYGEIMDVNNTDEPTYNAIEEIMSMTEGSESEVIKLYQLNIQPVSETETNDGMELVYEKIKDADVIIVASSIKENNVNSLINLVMDRLAQHYQSLELKNKIFGVILSGDTGAFQSVKSNLINKANNLGMLIPPDSSMIIGGEGTDYQKFVDSINSIKNATEELRQEVSDVVPEEQTEDGILSFSEFGSDESEEPGAESNEDLPEESDEDLPEESDDTLEQDDDSTDAEDVVDKIKDFKDFLGSDETEDSDEDEETEEVEDKEEENNDESDDESDDETNDEESVSEEKDWNLPDPPKEMKNVNHIKTFKEMTFKKDNEFVKDPENKKMPKGTVDTEKGSSTESTIKGKKGLNKKDDLRQQVDNSKMSKKSADVTKGGKKMDSGAKVDVKYFSGKGKKTKEQANKKGSDVENFSDWTKRI